VQLLQRRHECRASLVAGGIGGAHKQVQRALLGLCAAAAAAAAAAEGDDAGRRGCWALRRPGRRQLPVLLRASEQGASAHATRWPGRAWAQQRQHDQGRWCSLQEQTVLIAAS
jgi:hypothetical protein